MVKRVLLVAVLVILGVILFYLPRQVLNTNEETIAANRDKPKAPANSEETADHQEGLKGEEKENFQQLNSQLESAKGEQRVVLLDSLSSFFEQKAKYSEAASYAKQKAEQTNRFEDFMKTGLLFTEAASFAVEETKRDQLVAQAQFWIEKAQELQPKNLDLKVALAELSVMGENPMEGIFLLREVLQEEPKHQKALYQMGILSIQSGQWDKAVERLREYTITYPEDSKGWFFLGLSCKETQLNEEAKKSFLKVKELDNDPQVWASVDNYLNDL